ncbi:hypothetical protein D3C80_1900410 [compost metagenome]
MLIRAVAWGSGIIVACTGTGAVGNRSHRAAMNTRARLAAAIHSMASAIIMITVIVMTTATVAMTMVAVTSRDVAMIMVVVTATAMASPIHRMAMASALN